MSERGRDKVAEAHEREAMGARWAAALREGAPAEEVEAEILSLPADHAEAGVCALGAQGGEAALSLLARIGSSAPVALAAAAAEAMGDIRTPAAAQALDELARLASHKMVQKAARRSLHRLASQRIQVEQRRLPTSAVAPRREATLYRVIASSYDGDGTRSLWFAAERRLGGIDVVAVTINDVDGLTDCVGQDTTRRRFTEREAAMREKDPMPWVELPAEYAKQLVQEAVETARQAGSAIPSTYAPWADLIDSPQEPLQQALVYREISALEARLHPTLESESPRLFTQSEVGPWCFEPDRLGKWVRQLADPTVTRLIVTPETEEERRDRFVREAVRELLPPRVLHGLRRRLEETGYIFLRTGRELEARRAVAAAVTLEEERPLRPPHPFARALVERSLAIALHVERSGSRPSRLARLPGG